MQEEIVQWRAEGDRGVQKVRRPGILPGHPIISNSVKNCIEIAETCV